MDAALRRMRRLAGALPLTILWAVPLFLSLAAALWNGLDADALQALFAHPQLWSGLGLSLFTASAATLLALAASLMVLASFHETRLWNRLNAASAIGLALPHLAFAIGFAFLIMPSGLLARLVVGGARPPLWTSVQDPWGLSLIAALALKEIPFLLLLGWSALSRGDAARALQGQIRAARSLGHGEGSIWLRIVGPQLFVALRWPLVIVFVYGASVVDMALVIGPTQPPPLALTIWRDLNDAETAMNQRGLTGAVFLSAAIAVALAFALASIRAGSGLLRSFISAGPSALSRPRLPGFALLALVATVHAASITLLIMLSFAERWPYPAVLPSTTGLHAWSTLGSSAGPIWLSLGLATATAITAVSLAVAWFETQPQSRDRWLLAAAILALALPPILLAAGLYRVLLDLSWEGSLAALFIAQLGPVAAYVVIVLAGPYRGFDQRFIMTAHGLSVPPWRSFVKVKLPLLRAPLLAALAVGFAVSIVQFVPAQLVAAGRLTTLPMDAVTLTTGGDRALTSAYALALALPPLLVFTLTGLFGRPRWR